MLATPSCHYRNESPEQEKKVSERKIKLGKWALEPTRLYSSAGVADVLTANIQQRD